MPVRAFVGLGANLDHPRRRLAYAVRALARLPATRVVRVSPNYVSAPIGATAPQPDYVNAVVEVSTRLGATALLARLHAIERRAGRERDPGQPRNAPRAL